MKKIFVFTLTVAMLFTFGQKIGEPQSLNQNLYLQVATDINTATEQDVTVINQRLSEMSVEDTMKLVYNKNETKRYGGNQMTIKNIHVKDLPPVLLQKIQSALTKEYGREATNKEIDDYLDHITVVGCGYVALANIVLQEYITRPQQFEQDFGFPLYVINHDNNIVLNYDLVSIDIYTYMYDNNIKNGLIAYDTMKFLPEYLNSHHSENNYILVNNVNHFDGDYKENIQQVLSEGSSVLVYMNPTILYDEEQNEVSTGDAAHAVTVTGISENGNLTVSSCGTECFIKVSDYNSSGSLEYYIVEKE